MTVAEMVALEKAPDFDAEGRFIAELDGQPVGIIFAYIDKLRRQKKGFIRSLAVIPSHRGQGIEDKLAEMAIKELKKRGMDIAQSEANEEEGEIIHLWENLGFKLIRTFSLMTKDLVQRQSTIGENFDVTLKPVRKDLDDDLKMINWLDNECFKEHFNWRPSPVERTIHFVRENPFFKKQEWFFALLDKKHVGYIGLGVDEKYNIERNSKCGWILDIGVLKPHRRTGIGTRLMLYGMRRLKAMGMTTAMLGVDDKNVTQAIKLYRKVGFKVAKKDLVYERDLK